ncbi:hypothetical protein HAX54_049855, partial [Datura stramonium]|nr:hypothetical protein [Datura stramonium]
SKEGGEEIELDDDDSPNNNEEEGRNADEEASEHRSDSVPPDASEIVYEFFIKYYSTLEINAPTRQGVKKEPMLDMVPVRACPVDICKRTISRSLFGSSYEALGLTMKYDYQVEALKRVKQVITKDKLMLFRWMANIIAEDKEDAE